jgi:hypothetical protein
MNIQTALAQFITFGEHKDDAMMVIVAAPASTEIVFTVSTPIILEVFARCLNNEIALDELELWANVIESRSDIECSECEGVIYALSNSEQMGELNYEKLAQLSKLLQQ